MSEKPLRKQIESLAREAQQQNRGVAPSALAPLARAADALESSVAELEAQNKRLIRALWPGPRPNNVGRGAASTEWFHRNCCGNEWGRCYSCEWCNSADKFEQATGLKADEYTPREGI
jgi:hypothetical protein